MLRDHSLSKTQDLFETVCNIARNKVSRNFCLPAFYFENAKKIDDLFQLPNDPISFLMKRGEQPAIMHLLHRIRTDLFGNIEIPRLTLRHNHSLIEELKANNPLLTCIEIKNWDSIHFAELSEALQTNNHLKQLSVHASIPEQNNYFSFLDGLANNKSIREFTLGFKFFTQINADTNFIQKLNSNTTLFSLILDNTKRACPIESVRCEKLFSPYIKRNHLLALSHALQRLHLLYCMPDNLVADIRSFIISLVLSDIKYADAQLFRNTFTFWKENKLTDNQIHKQIPTSMSKSTL